VIFKSIACENTKYSMNRFVEYRTEVVSVSQVRRHRKISRVRRSFVTA